jgi:hypothetical protein
VEILIPEGIAYFRKRDFLDKAGIAQLCDAYEALREQTEYWHQMAILYADERTEAQANVRAQSIDGKESCHAGRDGDCIWASCPQLRDGEPLRYGRHCPLSMEEQDVSN